MHILNLREYGKTPRKDKKVMEVVINSNRMLKKKSRYKNIEASCSHPIYKKNMGVCLNEEERVPPPKSTQKKPDPPAPSHKKIFGKN